MPRPFDHGLRLHFTSVTVDDNSAHPKTQCRYCHKTLTAHPGSMNRHLSKACSPYRATLGGAAQVEPDRMRTATPSKATPTKSAPSGVQPPRRPPKLLKPAVYGPLPTFFQDDQEIDYGSYKSHLLHLAHRGVVPVCASSLGEAIHLNSEERSKLIRFTRATLDEAGLHDTPVVAGIYGSSTRETIQSAHAVAKAGADAGLVILPGYYAASLKEDQRQVKYYFIDVCNSSSIPIILYNFPVNSAGQDASSSVVEAIIRQAPNLCGVNLTCGGSLGKLVRLSSTINNDSTINATRRFPFLLLDGLIADLTPWMRSGGHGTVSEVTNMAPAAVMRLWTLLNKPDLTGSEKMEAERIQAVLSAADVAALPAGVRGMKYVLNKVHGLGKAPRRPLLPLEEEDGENLMKQLQGMLDLEKEYSVFASGNFAFNGGHMEE